MTLPLAEASRAAGVPAAAMKRWVDNAKVPLRRSDIKGAGPGGHRKFSRDTTLHNAITYPLTLVGLRSAHASRCAAAFIDKPSPGRPAGQLYRAGRTLLIVSKGDPAVVNVPPGAAIADILLDEAMAIVNVGAIVTRVDAALGTTSTNNSRRRHSAAPNDLELSRVKH